MNDGRAWYWKWSRQEKSSTSIPKYLLKNIKTRPHTVIYTNVYNGSMYYSQEQESSKCL